MTFQPTIPATGIVGWRFLERTYQQQLDTYVKGGQIQRDLDYFRSKIDTVTSAEALVADRRLLSVALTAFGLQDDLPNKAFVQKILEDGTTTSDALARRLTDDRYERLSDAFGFGPGAVRRIGSHGFKEDIVARYSAQSFETAVGEQDETMRITLFSMRELSEIAANVESERAQWFTLMSLPPLRSLFETALGFPSGFNQLDVEKQQAMFREKALRQFGTDKVADFADPRYREKLINTYLARDQIKSFNDVSSSAAIALALLQNA